MKRKYRFAIPTKEPEAYEAIAGWDPVRETFFAQVIPLLDDGYAENDDLLALFDLDNEEWFIPSWRRP